MNNFYDYIVMERWSLLGYLLLSLSIFTSSFKNMSFPILTHADLLRKIEKLDPKKYGKTRNYVTWTVSQLSPYISHWVITPYEIISYSLQKYSVQEAEMRYKEILWREYFLQTHRRKRNEIFNNMEEDKTKCTKISLLPESLILWTTWSSRINKIIQKLYTTWYLHNHERMRLASYCTHRWRLDRKKCADRTYYHFIDGELSSNHLSRQRVQSTFSNKPYFMNEENLFRFGWYTDEIYRWSYEEIEKKIFDQQRTIPFNGEHDTYQTLISDTSNLILADTHNDETDTILTPRDLHPQKIKNPQTTICFLDSTFLKQHPWSKKRIMFVSDYCAAYWIKLLYGQLKNFLQQNHGLTAFETRNPIYREAYESNEVIIEPYEWISPLVKKWRTKKFFPYREKTMPIFKKW